MLCTCTLKVSAVGALPDEINFLRRNFPLLLLVTGFAQPDSQ